MDRFPDEDGLAELFWGVARDLRHRTREALTPWDITPSQSRALGVLMRTEPQRLSDLAERLRIAPRSATEVVDQLQQRGLAERRPDAADRRVTLVALTEPGLAASERIRDARRAEADRFFGTLSADDQETLGRILRKLLDGGEQRANEG